MSDLVDNGQKHTKYLQKIHKTVAISPTMDYYSNCVRSEPRRGLRRNTESRQPFSCARPYFFASELYVTTPAKALQ